MVCIAGFAGTASYSATFYYSRNWNRSEDDLTHKLVDIIRVNQRLKESKEAGTPPLIVQDLVDLLQYHVTTYFDNEVSGIPQSSSQIWWAVKTLTQRLKGKEGRFEVRFLVKE